jgi:hypothetical protein
MKEKVKVLTGASHISILLFAVSVGNAHAQSITTKFKVVNPITKVEMVPAGDEKGHLVGILTRGGLALFENGEVANQTVVLLFDATLGKGGAYDTYSTITFEDGSGWVTKTKGSMERTSDQKHLLTKQAGEFIKGTGKYEGIKGNVNYTGIQYGASETGKGDWIGDMVFTYTLQQK